MIKNSNNYTFRAIKNNRTVDRYQTHSKRRFYNRIRTLNWEKGVKKVYLRVSYGNGFYNDGEYETENELLYALSVFIER